MAKLAVDMTPAQYQFVLMCLELQTPVQEEMMLEDREFAAKQSSNSPSIFHSSPQGYSERTKLLRLFGSNLRRPGHGQS